MRTTPAWWWEPEGHRNRETVEEVRWGERWCAISRGVEVGYSWTAETLKPLVNVGESLGVSES